MTNTDKLQEAAEKYALRNSGVNHEKIVTNTYVSAITSPEAEEYYRHKFAQERGDLREATIVNSEADVIDKFCDRFLGHLHSLGFNTDTCDGDEEPEWIIARWLHSQFEDIKAELENSEKAHDITLDQLLKPQELSDEEMIKFADWINLMDIFMTNDGYWVKNNPAFRKKHFAESTAELLDKFRKEK
jgi:hypothetical protein